MVCAVWAFFAALNILLVAFTARDRSGGQVAVSMVDDARHVLLPVVWALLTLGVVWSTRYARLDRAFWRTRTVAVVGAGLIIAFATDLVTDALWDAAVATPAESGRQTESHRFRPGIANFTWLDDFGVFWAAVAIGTARGYVLREREQRRAARVRAEELRAEATLLQSQLVAARLDALQRQMDPHFLFNTLNAVSALVERDPQGVRQMLAQLSDLLRHSMSTTTSPIVSLRQELALLERYTGIMRIRFAEALRLTMQVQVDSLDAMVPNLILQPLVENAIRHGIEHRAGGGEIVIEARRDGEQLVLRVHDEGAGSESVPPVTVPRDDSGVGLHNTTSRLTQLYGDAQSLTLTTSPLGGTVAEVRIPFTTHGNPGDHITLAEAHHD